MRYNLPEEYLISGYVCKKASCLFLLKTLHRPACTPVRHPFYSIYERIKFHLRTYHIIMDFSLATKVKLKESSHLPSVNALSSVHTLRWPLLQFFNTLTATLDFIRRNDNLRRLSFACTQPPGMVNRISYVSDLQLNLLLSGSPAILSSKVTHLTLTHLNADSIGVLLPQYDSYINEVKSRRKSLDGDSTTWRLVAPKLRVDSELVYTMIELNFFKTDSYGDIYGWILRAYRDYKWTEKRDCV